MFEYYTNLRYDYLISLGKTKEEMREFGRKISEARKGKYAGENHPNYGKKISEEAKRKMSETKKKRYSKENHPMFGKKHFS